MSPKRLAVYFLLLVALAVAVVWWSARPPVLPMVTVQSAPLVRTVLFSARVATLSRVEVGSTVTSRVLQVVAQEGQRVKAGDVLLRLENQELRAALEQAVANHTQAVARLAGLRSTGRSTAQAAVAQAESVLLAAQADLQRQKELVAQGFVSPARLDEATRAVAVADAQLNSARASRAANAEQGSELVQAQSQVDAARAAVDTAQAKLAQTVLTAPADAQVLVRAVEPGRIVQPGAALFTLALSGPLQLVAQVDERYLDQLQVGQQASVVADAFATQTFAARVLSIAPLVNAQRGAVEVKFSLTQAAPAFLREDMSLSVEVETARREQALVLPVAALRNESAGETNPAHQAQVRLVREGRVAEQTVKLGLRTLQAVEVLGGLAKSDEVLLGPTPEPGRRVRTRTAPEGVNLKPTGTSQDNAGSAMGNAMGR
ncbi:MAG: efflux RND transporter periplasmic adaptor subunit [Rhizobacter sp.]